jgi:hypothetical protein
MIVRYIGSRYPVALDKGKEYPVLEEKHGCYRVKDETGDLAYFEADQFEAVEMTNAEALAMIINDNPKCADNRKLSVRSLGYSESHLDAFTGEHYEVFDGNEYLWTTCITNNGKVSPLPE